MDRLVSRFRRVAATVGVAAAVLASALLTASPSEAGAPSVQEPAKAGGEPPAEPALEIRRELLGESVVAVVDERATGQARHDETRDRRLIVVRVDDLDCLMADPPPEAHGEKQVAPETARARPRALGHPCAIAHDVDRMATRREPAGKLLHEDL